MRHARRRRRSWRWTDRARWIGHEIVLFVIELAVCFALLGMGVGIAALID